jgi:hypothetical protein
MLNIVQHLRDSKHLSTIYTFLVLSCSVWGIVLLILRILNSTLIFNAFVSTLVFFTTQSNILVFVVTLLFFLNFGMKKWFKYLSFIGLVNIFITGLIFNTMLGPFMEHLDLIQYVLHTINPILYIILYYVFMPSKISFRCFYIGTIYPIFYIISVYLWIEPLLGNYMIHAFNDFEGSRYVYPFLDPGSYTSYPKGTMAITFIVLGITSLLVTFLLYFFKNKIEEANSRTPKNIGPYSSE